MPDDPPIGDGEPLGEPLDGYAPIVAPSGRRTLGRRWLEPGEHRVRFEAIGRHPSSTGHLIGVDCLELTRLPATSSAIRFAMSARLLTGRVMLRT